MSMRIAVITDAHANLPALDAALAAIRGDRAGAVYHTGDALGIGPFPAEVLDRLLHEPGMRLVMGNFDAWFVIGLPRPRPAWMGEAELAHQRWVHAQLEPALRSTVVAWPWMIEEDIGGVPVAFFRYVLDETGRVFADPVSDSDPAAMDHLFAPCRARLVFYGHVHYPTPVAPDIVGRARCVNPGALGCSPEPLARYVVLDIDREWGYQLTFRAVPDDPGPFFDAFEEREVPARTFIAERFFGGRGVAQRGRDPGLRVPA
jgi:predicted phosphodiesterase